ncbi:MAG: hypothetical protein ACKV19_22190 [Verrucomicrobiales bacterium]
MDQPSVTPATFASPPEAAARAMALAVLPAALAEPYGDGPFIVVVRTSEEFSRWLRDPLPGAEGLQVEGLMGESDPWLLAAQGMLPIPLDVVLDDPATEYSALYRLVDVRNARDVRVTIPARSGFLKAVRLAVSLQLPVRLLPGQPDSETLVELSQALEFYLRDPMVETPIEFFHSTLAVFRGLDDGSLWSFLEHDPAEVSPRDAAGQPLLASDFVESHFGRLLADGAECASCRWQSLCRGYFKHPNPAYECAGIKGLLSALEAAANEITGDLAAWEPALPHE